MADADTPKHVGLWELVAYFLRLGALGFGGPIALAGYMQRDLVPRGWITQEEYVQGPGLFPDDARPPGGAAGPCGSVTSGHGLRGASLVGVVFIPIPTYLLVLVISFFYVAYQGLPRGPGLVLRNWPGGHRHRFAIRHPPGPDNRGSGQGHVALFSVWWRSLPSGLEPK